MSNFYVPTARERVRMKILNHTIKKKVFDCKGSGGCDIVRGSDVNKGNVCLFCSPSSQINCCVICLDEYRKGDILCYSTNQKCNHV